MIKVERAKEISLKGIEGYLDQRIREAAERHNRSISLYNEFRLSEDMKKILEENGYKLTEGHSGKRGSFDIISW